MKNLVFLSIIGCLLGGTSFASKDKMRSAKNSFDEIKDISRLVDKTLDSANKEGDMERVQCISSRQASISALVDISERSMRSLERHLQGNQSGRVNNEMRKITVALTKVQQFSAEVDSCMSAQKSAENRTKVDVQDNKLTDLTKLDETEFGMNSMGNSLESLNVDPPSADVGGSAAGNGGSSESIAPPPATSPYQ
jgi:hypothetical protein